MSENKTKNITIDAYAKINQCADTLSDALQDGITDALLALCN